MPPLSVPSWLKIKPHRKLVTQLHVPTVKFLGEQDGPVERTAKARWLPILSASPTIRRAFLVRASYEAPNDIHVMLALCSTGGPDLTLIEALRVPYARSEEHTSELQSRVDLVCRLLLEKKK